MYASAVHLQKRGHVSSQSGKIITSSKNRQVAEVTVDPFSSQDQGTEGINEKRTAKLNMFFYALSMMTAIAVTAISLVFTF